MLHLLRQKCVDAEVNPTYMWNLSCSYSSIQRKKRGSLGSLAETNPSKYTASGFVCWGEGQCRERTPSALPEKLLQKRESIRTTGPANVKKARTHGAVCSCSEVAATCGGHPRLAGGRSRLPSHSPQPPVFSLVSGSKITDSET